ncbi:hypothetical protein V1509DRAFT_618978 [Lipomyces kononenkoae]
MRCMRYFRLGKQTDGGGFKADAQTQAVEAVRRAYKGDLQDNWESERSLSFKL